MTVAVGSRLGPYEILSPLGAGGMGEVWRARDTRLEREVAIKVLPADVTSDRERVKRFEKEARSASALNHPNIVTIYDIGSSGSVSYIAMERVDGKTLREILLAGALPVRRLLAIASQAADGLAVAHRAGIVHRDLKPENLMVTRDGLVKILDFGLAKLTSTGSGSDEASRLPTETGTSPGAVLGTVGYMSPEQAGAQPLDFRSDQFSFGSILYEMATGKRAFQKGTAIDTLSAILHEDPRPVSESNPEAPAPLRWIVERCLAKDPDGRYAATRDLARDLATLRDRLSEASLSGAARAATPAPSTRSSRARLAVFAAFLLLALAAGALAARPVWRKRAFQQPTLRQITFRRGGIMFARFAPDGQILYGAFGPAVAPGKPFELFSARPGASE
ncbi:MAG TPA: serine/threonine-protein kinase, partial [Thermoanaerobaculia bacterium]|nr:serine/threonine-protein kinase [Thermoanaerobaculia bacterium]